ncbi:nucleoside monophosphate kinase [Fodinibius salsisoli]|uniref:Nucleoside monophosphate kinase n=1 Tax=Fodinibius salsisoli TaxID=2820877 RepID=A0ABT3PNP6_9BACT|nr:nucleoside monophosphate kinase [Fodinibius salsisoli]MCW9707486.1 nucleoside monophosphate kinase [Fodinibius salsisoli]
MSPATIQPDLISFLEQKSTYEHEPSHVQHIQTHISHVFIVSPYVYKIKKPVDFGFLDYSTLEKRYTCCRQEVALNKRLAGDVYLGVMGIEKSGENYSFTSDLDSDFITEYAVKMRKLENKYFLHNYIDKGRLQEEHLNRVADKLADFYEQQEQDKELAKWGAIKKIKVNTDENFTQVAPFIRQTIDENSFKAIRYYTSSYYEQYSGLFKQRMEGGCIVDGHGDLHLEHIHITEDQVRIYDCIEFNERFRYGDWAADLAFLAMDLDFNDCFEEERYLINRMAEKLQDHTLADIIDFYKCYRAVVKGKVKSLQSTEDEVPLSEQKEAVSLARRYFDLALRYALIGSEPVVLIFMGQVGTGKSTLAKKLSDKLGIEHLSSDRIRKASAGLPLTERTPASKREMLYSSKISDNIYHTLLTRAVKTIAMGRSIILDATYGQKSMRMQLVQRLTAKSIPYIFIEAQAPEDIIVKRLKDREERDDVVSDARVEDFYQLSNAYIKPTEMQQLLHVNTNQEVTKSINELYTKLIDFNL